MSKNMNSTGELYKSAAENYENTLKQYTGNSGFTNSINQAKAGAAIEAANAQAQAQTAARNAGLSKAQAAAKGNASVSKNYMDSFNAQQDKAYNAGKDSVSSADSYMKNQQSEDTNRFNKSWGTLGGVVNGVGSLLSSDERLKNYKDISSTLKYKNPNYTKTLIIEVKK